MSQPQIIRHGQYSIQQVRAQSFNHDRYPRLQALSNMIVWTLWAIYLAVQAQLISRTSNLIGSIPWTFWLGLFAEFCISLNDLVHALHLIARLLPKAKVPLPRPHYLLLNDKVPIIDVFIMCCGEPVDIILNTTASAACQDYPPPCLRVLVCDDAHNDDLRHAIEKFNAALNSDVRVTYGARNDKGKDFKAGNLRFGIEETARLGGGDFFACLDADMIADPQWLRRMVPHLLLDERMGMVNQPQHYYNAPKNDPLSDQGEFDLWFTIFEPLNDRIGQAMCQGSGWLARRSAIEEIGGWPLVATGEDVMCAQKLLQHDWKLSYVREYLQHGRTAETLGSRIEQKTRWAIDHIAFVRTFGWRSTTTVLGALTWREFTSITTTIGLIILPLALLSPIVGADHVTVTRHDYALVVKLLVLMHLLGKINDCLIYRHFGLSRLAKYQSLETWSAPYAAGGLISNLLPGAVDLTFSVTGTFRSDVNERSKRKRAGLIRRLLSPGTRTFAAYVLCASTLTLSLLVRSHPKSLSKSPAVLELHALPGPALKMTVSIWKIFIPIWYMIYPPDVPDWKELMEGTGKGALKPKNLGNPEMKPTGSEKDNSYARVWSDVLELCVLLYYIKLLW